MNGEIKIINNYDGSAEVFKKDLPQIQSYQYNIFRIKKPSITTRSVLMKSFNKLEEEFNKVNNDKIDHKFKRFRFHKKSVEYKTIDYVLNPLIKSKKRYSGCFDGFMDQINKGKIEKSFSMRTSSAKILNKTSSMCLNSNSAKYLNEKNDSDGIKLLSDKKNSKYKQLSPEPEGSKLNEKKIPLSEKKENRPVTSFQRFSHVINDRTSCIKLKNLNAENIKNLCEPISIMANDLKKSSQEFESIIERNVFTPSKLTRHKSKISKIQLESYNEDVKIDSNSAKKVYLKYCCLNLESSDQKNPIFIYRKIKQPKNDMHIKERFKYIKSEITNKSEQVKGMLSELKNQEKTNQDLLKSYITNLKIKKIKMEKGLCKE